MGVNTLDYNFYLLANLLLVVTSGLTDGMVEKILTFQCLSHNLTQHQTAICNGEAISNWPKLGLL